MMKIILLLALLYNSLNTIAQNKYYERQINLNADVQQIFSITVDTDSTFAVAGQYTSWSDAYWKSFFLKANLYFDTLCTQYYTNDEKDLGTWGLTKGFQSKYVVPINKIENNGTTY